MSYTVEKDWTTNAGFRAVVILIHRTYGENYRCGYVGVPPQHPLYKTDYADAPVDAHGGLTFSDGGQNYRNYPVQHEGLWWFVFDCDHHGDSPAKCTLHFVSNECEELAKQLTEIK